ncbi:MAG: SIR2 family protein [Clostridia bacterium]|nr:SIR2 family protein [Clostridia bacterium]
MTIKDVVKYLCGAPIIFAGPGLPARYCGVPDYYNLLRHFAVCSYNNNEYAMTYYSMEARLPKDSSMEEICHASARLIERDYTLKCLHEHGSSYESEEDVLGNLDRGLTPFRYDLAAYLNTFSMVKEQRRDEYDLLRSLCGSNISGFITTNYDSILESLAPDYKCFFGRKDIISKPIPDTEFIYKILGSSEKPDSIIITDDDFRRFNERSFWVADRILQLFFKHPIVFMGFGSLDDAYRIISWVARGLDSEFWSMFNEQIAVVKLDEKASDPVVETTTLLCDDWTNGIELHNITLSDYSQLYRELAAVRRI